MLPQSPADTGSPAGCRDSKKCLLPRPAACRMQAVSTLQRSRQLGRNMVSRAEHQVVLLVGDSFQPQVLDGAQWDFPQPHQDPPLRRGLKTRCNEGVGTTPRSQGSPAAPCQGLTRRSQAVLGQAHQSRTGVWAHPS